MWRLRSVSCPRQTIATLLCDSILELLFTKHSIWRMVSKDPIKYDFLIKCLLIFMGWRLSTLMLVLSPFLSRVWLKLMLLLLLNHDRWLFLSMLFASMTAWLWNGGSFIIVVLLVANELLLFNPSISQAVRLVICGLRPFVPQIRLESYRIIGVPV
jgi:hypothetical protein